MRIPIPVVQRTVDPGFAAPAARAQEVEQSGLSGIARGLQQVADTRQRNADAAQEQFERLQHEQRKARVNERLSNDRLTWTKQLQDEQTAAPPGADGFTPAVLKKMDAYRDQAAKGIADEHERRMYTESFVRLREAVGEHAMVFESTSRRNFRRQELTGGIDRGSQVVAIDPTQYADVRSERLAAISSSMDISAEDKAALSLKAKSEMSFAAARTQVERDPDGMLRVLNDRKEFDAHPFLPDVDPQHLAQLQNHARALVAQRDARLQSATDKARREAEEALDGMRKFWAAGGLPDIGYQNEVLSKTAPFPEVRAAAQALIDQSLAGAGHGSSSLPRQEERIRTLEAQLARGSNPESEKQLAYLRQVTDTQRREYAENPWAAAARFARAPSVPDQPLPTAEAVPQYIAQVLPLMPTIESLVDGPVSPLQPGQAKQFEAHLSAMPPAQRAETLGQTGAMLGSVERIDVFANQLDKGNRPLGLALRLGSDRTTAGRSVSELVLRGADALKDKTVKRDDTALTGWKSEIAGMVRGLLGDAKAEQDVIDAAYYVRAAMDVQGIEVSGYDLKASAEQAVKLVIGQPVARSGVRTVLPRGMSESDFDEKLRAYTPESLKTLAPSGTVFVRGQPRTLEQLSTSLPGMGLALDPRTKRYTPVSAGAFVTLDKEGSQPLQLEVR